MPHQCTNCSHVFPDGSKAMLSGCPDCGGNTFQFLPKGAVSADTDEAPSSEEVPIDSAEPQSQSDSHPGTRSRPELDPSPDSDTERPADSTGSSREGPPSRGPIGRATAAVREWVWVDSPTPAPPRDESTRGTSRDDATGDSDPEPETDAAGSADGSAENTEGEVDVDGRSVSASATADGSPTASDEANVEPELPTDAGPDTSADVDDHRNDRNDRNDRDHGDGIGTGTEDSAQADARRDVIAADELPSKSTDSTVTDPRTPPPDAAGGRIAAEPAAERPDLDELRRELNDQFESIKIVAPGQYELNLMELYDREEYIIALREDGRYAIEAPETWLGRRIDRD